MGNRPMPYFLARASEWWDAADRLRARVPEGDPVLSVWREAAWAHLLLTRGLHGAAVASLRQVFRKVTGAPAPDVLPPRCEADVLSVAADLFARMRSIVSARYPAAFDRPVASPMCTAIALAYSELPLSLIEEHDLAKRRHDRGGEKEVRFYWQAAPALLPVWWEGRLQIVRWGNKDRAERKLPPTGWTWQEKVEGGWWSALAPEPVVIPASHGLMGGVWFKVKQGMRGLLVRDRAGEPVVFMLCEPATRYYQVMTRANWKPLLIDEVI